MFKKLLASVGIGGAKVDTVLNSETIQPGEIFSARIIITGGDTEQDISGLELALMTKVKAERNDEQVVLNKAIASWKISDNFVINPEEVREIPFQAQLPYETPICNNGARKNQTSVWLATGLNIDMALDAGDKDPINVIATELQSKVLEAVSACGYQMQKADVEEGQLRGNGFHSTIGCYQELEYRPGGFSLLGYKEIEVSFVATDSETHILFELDRSFSGDTYRSITLSNSLSQNEVNEVIKQIIA